jgi:hypothetical protein
MKKKNSIESKVGFILLSYIRQLEFVDISDYCVPIRVKDNRRLHYDSINSQRLLPFTSIAVLRHVSSQ